MQKIAKEPMAIHT